MEERKAVDQIKLAVDILNRFNEMDFNDFADLIEKESGIKVTDKERENFKFMGLRNTDYLIIFDEENYGHVKIN